MIIDSSQSISQMSHSTEDSDILVFNIQGLNSDPEKENAPDSLAKDQIDGNDKIWKAEVSAPSIENDERINVNLEPIQTEIQKEFVLKGDDDHEVEEASPNIVNDATQVLFGIGDKIINGISTCKTDPKLTKNAESCGVEREVMLDALEPETHSDGSSVLPKSESKNASLLHTQPSSLKDPQKPFSLIQTPDIQSSMQFGPFIRERYVSGRIDSREHGRIPEVQISIQEDTNIEFHDSIESEASSAKGNAIQNDVTGYERLLPSKNGDDYNEVTTDRAAEIIDDDFRVSGITRYVEVTTRQDILSDTQELSTTCSSMETHESESIPVSAVLLKSVGPLCPTTSRQHVETQHASTEHPFLSSESSALSIPPSSSITTDSVEYECIEPSKSSPTLPSGKDLKRKIPPIDSTCSEATQPQGKEALFAELKAIKIASITARNTAIEADIASKFSRLQEINKELKAPAIDTVKHHIKLLHDYNDIRDIGQGLIGMIAEQRGVRIGDLYEEFGVGLQD
ncbi:hypothetical protein K3495_g3741 [Podosphaera aphanis]|nr:hypothetical protein K3495_g3741 [Podosphaera aphanis]